MVKQQYTTKPLAIDPKWKVITRTTKLFNWCIWKGHWLVMPNNQVVKLHHLLDDASALKLFDNLL